jgi:hypothetical protein
MASRDACPKLRRSHQARRFPSSLTFVSTSGSRLQSLHQTPIGDPSRSLVATPCPRNTSVPSLVQSNSSWLFVQLAPGSRKGQSSQEKRTLAPRKCSEGRWVPNQSSWLPGIVQETIACFAVIATITDLRISSGSHHAGFTLGSFWSRLQLDGWFTHPRSFSSSAPRNVSCRRLAPGAA